MSAVMERVRERIAALEAERSEINEELSAIAANPARRFKNDAEAMSRIEELRVRGEAVAADMEEARERLADLELQETREMAARPVRDTRVGGAFVRSEPSVYSEHNAREQSFFRDAFSASFQSDPRAQERLSRHMTEMERRDITTATVNGLVPPRYLLDQAAMMARAMRPLADVMPNYTLPADGMSFTITRITTGTATAVQTTQNTGPTETDLQSTDLVLSVCTIMGAQDISRQLFERSPGAAPADQLILADLVADYATKLDAQIISGAGSNGEHLGILNVSDVNTGSWTGTTVASFYTSVAGAINSVNTARYAPATVIAMHPRRWNWLLSKSDDDGRPLVTPYTGQASNPVGLGGSGYGVVGSLLGLPVVIDANIPTNLGASTDEDRVIVTRLDDHGLWEMPGGPMTFTFEAVSNAPATVRLAVAGYSAFTAARYPKSTTILSGAGFKPPTF